MSESENLTTPISKSIGGADATERDGLLDRRVLISNKRSLRDDRFSASSFDDSFGDEIELDVENKLTTKRISSAWPIDASEDELSSDNYDPLIISAPQSSEFSFQRLWLFMGPGFLVSIAYIDPGNFDTDIVAGASFGYDLIWVLIVATLLGLLLQNLSARLGVVTGLNLAEVCAIEYPNSMRLLLWAIAEITIIASDIPEVIGTAFALKFLFNMPLWIGVIVTFISVLLFLSVNYFGVRKLEMMIASMIGVVVVCFIAELFMSDVEPIRMLAGLIPSFDWNASYAATSLIGAVVMPHNLFLHSALVQTRPIQRTLPALDEACFYNLLESGIALSVSLFINVAILSMSAAEFTPQDKAGLQSAPALLKQIGKAGPVLFSIALLASGQSSTMTGTYAGQFVMEGFLNLKMKKWKRAMVTRTVAIAPSLVVALLAGEDGADGLIVLSQVVLSVLLPFALIPLVKVTSDRRKMGQFANSNTVYFVAITMGTGVTIANISLVYFVVEPWLINLSGVEAIFARLVSVILLVGYIGVLCLLMHRPLADTNKVNFQMVSTSST